MKKKKYIIITIITILLISIPTIILIRRPQKKEIIDNEYQLSNNSQDKTTIVQTYEEYQNYLQNASKNLYLINPEIKEEDFINNSYILYETRIDFCNESLTFQKIEEDNSSFKIYFNSKTRCGVCAPQSTLYSFKIEKNKKKNIEIYYKTEKTEDCDSNIVYKPMIYIYPKEKIALTITLENKQNITHTYPKYNKEWNISVEPNGNIYDYQTKRNYYGLYWEGLDTTKLNMEEGFVIKGEETIPFLEEKLELLGLNERESNEFIIYWLSELENNPYNFIRFRTLEEINEYMPLTISEKPDTLIRILMDFKPLNEYIKVKEQQLEKKERMGFTIVEWGGIKH